MEIKKVLVTGASGYIGRHVVKEALNKGYEVIASDFDYTEYQQLLHLPNNRFHAYFP